MLAEGTFNGDAFVFTQRLNEEQEIQKNSIDAFRDEDPNGRR